MGTPSSTQTRMTSWRSIPSSFDSSSGVRWFAMPLSSSGNEKARSARRARAGSACSLACGLDGHHSARPSKTLIRGSISPREDAGQTSPAGPVPDGRSARCGRALERHLLSLRGRTREELDAVRDDLDGVPALTVLLPRAALQAAVDGHALSLREVVGAGLGLAVPDGDPDEVGLRLACRARNREQEARELLVAADLL